MAWTGQDSTSCPERWLWFCSVLFHPSVSQFVEFIKTNQPFSNPLKDALYSYYMKNYPDVFAVSGKTMVRKADGSFILLSGEELMAMKKENKIGIENVKAMGGRVSDFTQKPVLVLKE